MKLLLDACMPLEWAEFLRRNGHECLAWLDLGPPNASDTDIMAWAHKHGFVVLTNDLDFGKLLAFSRATHPSVIQFRAQDIRPSALGSLALQALKEHHPRLGVRPAKACASRLRPNAFAPVFSLCRLTDTSDANAR